MMSRIARHEVKLGYGASEGWLMHFVHVLGERLARPRYLYPDELSAHLQRDIGLTDGRMTSPRSRP